MPIFIGEQSKPVHKEKVRLWRRTSRHPLKLGITRASKQISVKAAMLTNAGKSVKEIKSVTFTGSFQFGYTTNIHNPFA